ncbi:MAG: ABC transporter ATP-binding protein [Gammaproteobacteria bacterium]
MAGVRFRQVTKSFGTTPVLRGVDIEFGAGRFTVVVGPSGCGKSTLLRLIAGLDEPTAGRIEIDGVDAGPVPPGRRGVAMVFQSYALYPHMTVRDNLAFGLRTAGARGAQVDARVHEVADKLGIRGLLDRKPAALSGGQRQRVAIGRALVRRPRVFLFDEPLSNLDPALRARTRVEILNLHRELGTTMIYVTHDQTEAMTLAQDLVVLNGGRVEQVGAPNDLYDAPCNTFVAGFLGSPGMNFIDCTLVQARADSATVALIDGARVEVAVDVRALRDGDRVTLGIRPEHLALGRHGDLRGIVNAVERLGSETQYYLESPAAPGRLLSARAVGRPALRAGDSLDLTIAAADAHLFDREGRALPRIGGKRRQCPSPTPEPP